MKLLKTIIVFVFLFSANLSAQFSIKTFLNEPLDQSMASIKEKLAGKKIEEKEVKNFKSILYYDWLDPISVKVGYLFTPEGKPNGKVLSNGNKTEEDSQKLFDMSKASLIKKYGSNFSENSMMGITMLHWAGLENSAIMLSHKGETTMLTVMKK